MIMLSGSLESGSCANESNAAADFVSRVFHLPSNVGMVPAGWWTTNSRAAAAGGSPERPVVFLGPARGSFSAGNDTRRCSARKLAPRNRKLCRNEIPAPMRQQSGEASRGSLRPSNAGHCRWAGLRAGCCASGDSAAASRVTQVTTTGNRRWIPGQGRAFCLVSRPAVDAADNAPSLYHAPAELRPRTTGSPPSCLAVRVCAEWRECPDVSVFAAKCGL